MKKVGLLSGGMREVVSELTIFENMTKGGSDGDTKRVRVEDC